MYDTSGTHSVCYAAPPDNDVAVRIAWLKGEVARAESHVMAAREAESLRALAMAEPISTEEAFAWFGTFLGLFPPFAIFTLMLVKGTFNNGALYWAFLFVLMNLICCVVGRKFGRALGRMWGDPRARSWVEHIPLSILIGLAWAVVTGGLGGAVAFGIGAIFGVVCAAPVALAAFPLFALLHRIQSHGGMIEERDLWPLAFGIPLTAAAMIMTVGIK
jgi:hypothetical protein